jgi:hypothetical protein
MEAAHGKARAVGGDEKVAALEIGGEGRDQMKLDRPLPEFGGSRDGLLTFFPGFALFRNFTGGDGLL